MWTVLVCVSSLLLILVLWMIERRVRFKCLDQIPGPVGVPIFGNALQMGTNPIDFLAALVKFTKEHGKTIKLWIAHRPMVFTSDANMVEFILTSTKHITKSQDYTYLKSWLGKGLLIANGQHWKDHRKMLTPAFHFKLLENSVEVFNNAGDDLLKKLSESVDKKYVDIYPLVTRYTLEVICETAMGTSLNARSNQETSEYIQAIKDQCVVLLKRAFSPWKQIPLLYAFSEEYQTEKKAIKILHNFSNSVISKRRETLKEKNESKEEEDNDSGIKKRVCFLDLLLEASVDGRDVSDEEIREEVDTFMFAGHDTSSSAICFCLYELAENPDIQNKLFEEIKSVIGETKRNISMKDLSELKYLELVIKETLRKYPSVPFYARELLEDAFYNGFILPRGLTVEVFTLCLHRDPELYPEPEKFDPDRFLPENMNSKSSFAYVPFSAGPRNCIGQKFAMYEMKVIIANIIYQFEFNSVGPEFVPILSGEAVLKSANGVHVGLKKRN